MNRECTRHRDQGFTLIELLVVIIILGILAAIAVPIFMNQRQKGWDAAVRSDLRSAATAQETYLTEADPSPFANTVAELLTVGFRHSSGDNYFGGTFAMTVAAQSSYSYCMTARSATGNYFALSSSHGWVVRPTPIDPTTCL